MPRQKNPQAVVFDMDGTLLDSETAARASLYVGNSRPLASTMMLTPTTAALAPVTLGLRPY